MTALSVVRVFHGLEDAGDALAAVDLLVVEGASAIDEGAIRLRNACRACHDEGEEGRASASRPLAQKGLQRRMSSRASLVAGNRVYTLRPKLGLKWLKPQW